MSRITLLTQREMARWYKLKDHPVQLSLIGAVARGVRFPVVPAGRRCLERGTLVATPSGPRAIESLRVGDAVIGFEGDKPRITHVTATHENGLQMVEPLESGGREYLAATSNHKLWACNEHDFDKRPGRVVQGYSRTVIDDLTPRHRIRREYAFDLIGNEGKRVPLAYVLGALLGDGCSRNNKSTTGQYQRTLHISAGTPHVPAKIAALLGCGYRRTHENNYTWALDVGLGALDAVPFYREWCSGRYAHEKMAVWEEIDTWDKESALDFLAGVIDTDGAIYYKSPKQVEGVLNIAMQARSVVECCDNIVFKFFQDPLSVGVDARPKYKNGHVYSAKTTSNLQLINIMGALRHRLVQKGLEVDVGRLAVRNVRADRIGFKRGKRRLALTYDITVANNTNLYCLHRGGIVTSNSGKTERAKRFVAKEAMRNPGERYFIAAPTHAQVKKIYWADMKAMCLASLHPRQPSESELIIFLPNGTEIHLIGLDKPQRIEGILWTGGVIDEIADVKETAWAENIKPALDTVTPQRPNYRAWCWLIGVPDGLNHYYEMAQYAKRGNDPEWQLFAWTSEEILPADVISSAKRTMSARQYRQEYQAAFEGATGRIYEDYDTANLTTQTIAPHEKLLWMHDQNFTPLSSAIGVQRGDALCLLDEIVLESAISKQSAVEFVERYKNHQNRHIELFGDPAGRAGEKHGHASDYSDIEGVLMANGWHVHRRVKKAAPAIKDRQNAVRAKICAADGTRTLFVNAEAAPYCHKGLSTVQVLPGSSYQEDQRNKYQHITTAIGYCVDVIWPARKAYTLDTIS